MAYYRSWRYSNWERKPSKYDKLKKIFGDSVDDIKDAFLKLNPQALDALFSDYGSAYGNNAEKYARKTFDGWKTGEIKLSGQTLQRLIELVPPYLSNEQRIKIVQALFDKYRHFSGHHNVKIDILEPDEGFRQLDSILDSISVDEQLSNIPSRVMDAATWLYDNDITAARALLAQVDKHEHDIIRRSAKTEIEILKKAIKAGQIESASYTLKLPNGNLEVNVYKPSFFARIFNL